MVPRGLAVRVVKPLRVDLVVAVAGAVAEGENDIVNVLGRALDRGENHLAVDNGDGLVRLGNAVRLGERILFIYRSNGVLRNSDRVNDAVDDSALLRLVRIGSADEVLVLPLRGGSRRHDVNVIIHALAAVKLRVGDRHRSVDHLSRVVSRDGDRKRARDHQRRESDRKFLFSLHSVCFPSFINILPSASPREKLPSANQVSEKQTLRRVFHHVSYR